MKHIIKSSNCLYDVITLFSLPYHFCFYILYFLINIMFLRCVIGKGFFSKCVISVELCEINPANSVKKKKKIYFFSFCYSSRWRSPAETAHTATERASSDRNRPFTHFISAATAHARASNEEKAQLMSTNVLSPFRPEGGDIDLRLYYGCRKQQRAKHVGANNDNCNLNHCEIMGMIIQVVGS